MKQDLRKTSSFAQSLRQAQILVLKILKVFLLALWNAKHIPLGRLKPSPSLTLGKIECFAKVAKRCPSLLLCLFILLVPAQPVVAYILPAKQILAFMIERLGSCHTLMVSQKTVIYDPGLEGGMQELDETLYYGYPERFRSEMSADGVERIRVVDLEGALVVLNGKIIRETEKPFDHCTAPLLYRDIELLSDRLSRLGINLKLVSLGRFKEKIAYVIGAKYPDESVPQVWIDKETFRPIRFILDGGDGNGAPLQEIEYTDYKLLDKSNSYPARILFFEGGTLVRMNVFKTFEINPEVPDQLFDVATLKSMYEPIADTQPTPMPASELDEVKKSIQEFKKIFE